MAGTQEGKVISPFISSCPMSRGRKRREESLRAGTYAQPPCLTAVCVCEGRGERAIQQEKGCTLCQKIHPRAILKKDSLTPRQGHQTDRGRGGTLSYTHMGGNAGTRWTFPSFFAPHNWGDREGTPRKPMLTFSASLVEWGLKIEMK